MAEGERHSEFGMHERADFVELLIRSSDFVEDTRYCLVFYTFLFTPEAVYSVRHMLFIGFSFVFGRLSPRAQTFESQDACARLSLI